MILIALGANLDSVYGTPEATLRAACVEIERRGIKIMGSSRIYLSAPVSSYGAPVSDQPWYHNAVISVQTDLAPEELLEILHDIEADFGRVRRKKDAARVLDLDIVIYKKEVISNEDSLIIPHPRMHERGFVLHPMADIVNSDENWQHPVSGEKLQRLICALPEDQEIKTLSESPLYDERKKTNEAA